MHKSRLAGFIIDCKGTDPKVASKFWGPALGMAEKPVDDGYVPLDDGPRGLHIEVQNVSHESRVHLDIETDNLEAEARRLEALGAKRVGNVKRWIVMEAPTGQRFCVVNAKDLSQPGFTTWP